MTLPEPGLPVQDMDCGNPVRERHRVRVPHARIVATFLRRAWAIALACCAIAAPQAAAAAPVEVEQPAALRQKADPWLLRKLQTGARIEFLAVLDERADLSGASGLTTRRAKGRYIVDSLRAVALRAQAPLLDWLSGQGIPHRAYWIANLVLVEGDAAVAQALAERGEVRRLAANPVVRFPSPSPASGPRGPEVAAKAATGTIEWGVAKIRAPEFWGEGHTGQGIVIAGADTGVDWTHPALLGRYRGWDGATATHDYNWHDAVHVPGSSCGADAPAPCDDDSHGTHTMGTMVGDDGGANQIGVAPGARWIGCRNMDRGNGTPARYIECFQWFLAPTDMTGLHPDPDKAPDVVNNSWHCPASEGCVDPEVLRSAVEALQAAGIAVVVSAGNIGTCSSIADAPSFYEAAITVGATDTADAIADFSSRGPVTIDGSNRIKPEVSAPGVNVRSSTPGGAYAGKSGTSMAAPHVSGAIALLLSAFPALSGQPLALRNLIERAAVPRTAQTGCGGVPGSALPNNTFGWGRLDARQAYDAYHGLPAVSLNVDGSIAATRYDGLTDGLLILRYLFGLTGPALTAGAVGAAATRTDAGAIASYLDSIHDSLDVDGDGTVDALTDGLLILRYLLGMREDALIAGAVAPGAPRASAAEIATYIGGLLP